MVRARRRRSAAALLSGLALAACGGGGSAADAFTVRDSADLRIAESAAPAWSPGEAWRLADEPVLQIGVIDGAEPYQFGRIAGLVRTSDGGVVVADGQAGEIRWFDARGRHLRTVGRKGGGPGEFNGLATLRAAGGDTLVVYDGANRRFTWIAPDGALAAEVPFRPEGLEGSPILVGRLPGGDLLLTLWPFNVAEGLTRDTVTVARSAPDGRWEALGDFPATESFLRSTTTGNTVSFSRITRPFGRTLSVAPLADGFATATADRYEVVRHDADGRPVLSVRRPVPNAPVTPADVERLREMMHAAAPNASARAGVDWQLRDVPLPETKPAYAGMMADGADHLWVRELRDEANAPAEWSVFAPDGRLLGSVAIPAGFTAREIGDDYVLGVWRDELDVQYVRLYALEKPR